jgi:toxin CptA
MNVYQAPIKLRLRPSRIGRAGLLTAALLALAAIGLADLPFPARVLAALAVGISVLRAWRPPMPLELRLQPDGRLEWRDAATSWQAASVLGSSVVNPWLSVLAWRPEGQRRVRYLVVYPDSLHPDDFRRLRVWLRWRAEIEGRDGLKQGR